MEIELIGAPTRDDWIECRRRALVTMWGRDVWNDAVCAPSPEWRHKILKARNSLKRGDMKGGEMNGN